jgi:hypothetical protein
MIEGFFLLGSMFTEEAEKGPAKGEVPYRWVYAYCEAEESSARLKVRLLLIAGIHAYGVAEEIPVTDEVASCCWAPLLTKRLGVVL